MRALRDAPYAFETLAEEAERRTDADWIDFVEQGARGEQMTIAVAIGPDGRAVGMAGGYIEPDDPDAVVVFGVWVDPALRRGGVASRLVGAVEEWARGRGLARTRLAVMQTNVPAVRLYERLGYRDLGERKLLRGDPALVELLLVRELQAG